MTGRYINILFIGVQGHVSVYVWRISCPFKNVWGKIAVQLKSHGESEIACN